jgi:plasmid stability protein
MAQLLIRDIPPEVVDSLKERAKRNRRSLQSEARLILEQAVDRSTVIERLADSASEMRARLAGRAQTDSVAMIREARERRYEATD